MTYVNMMSMVFHTGWKGVLDALARFTATNFLDSARFPSCNIMLQVGTDLLRGMLLHQLQACS